MVVTSVLGWSAVGFLARCYQLGIQKRNIFENFGGHAALMAAFGTVGYWVHGLEERQNVLIQAKKEQILRNRERLAERNGGGGKDEADD